MKDLAHEEHVVIKRGFAAIALSALWVFFGCYLLVGYIESFSTSTQSYDLLSEIGFAAFAMIVGVGFVYIAISLLRQKYVISLKGIEVTGLFGKRFVAWSDVRVVNSIPTFAGANNFKLFLHNGKSVTVFTAFMANYKKSAKALIEAVYRADPKIELNFVFGNEFEAPPYGIFKRES